MSALRTKAVANSFIDLSRKKKSSLDPITLQMLVYFAHGWFLAIEDEALIGEDVEADSAGIVINSIRDSVLIYGKDKIRDKLSEYDSEEESWIEPTLESKDPANEVIKRVWDIYHSQSETDLRKLTIGFGTPWYQVWDNSGDVLPINNQIVKEYFTTLAHDKKLPSNGNPVTTSDIKLDNDIITSESEKSTSDDLERYDKSFHRLLTNKKQTKWKKVKHYATLWNPGKGRGIIKVILEDEVDYKIVVKSVEEMNCITKVLSDEKNVYYNIASGSIASGWVPAREHHHKTEVRS